MCRYSEILDIYYWSNVRDEGIPQAISDAADAQSTADSKIVTFYQDNEPSAAESSTGDLWYDTNNDNYLRRYDGDSWEVATGWFAKWSRMWNDDGHLPADDADVTGDQNHSVLNNIGETDHQPNILVNGQMLNDIEADSSGSYVSLDSDLNVHCDCLVITRFTFDIYDMCIAEGYVRDHNNTVKYYPFVEYCFDETNLHCLDPQSTIFVPSGGSWKWVFTVGNSANDVADISKEHVITLETTGD
jgi:hypothetical protein